MTAQSRTMHSVIMTAFITHCWKSARQFARPLFRLELTGLLIVVCLAWGAAGPARAQLPAAEVSTLKIERAGDSLLLSATVNFELSTAVEDALLKGVAMIFVAEADVVRERWYWSNKKVVTAERHMRLAYQPLTRRWRLNVGSGLAASGGLGMTLNQNFDELSEALAAVQRLSRWPIADVSELEPGQRHLIEFHFRLDMSQLPRPLQIGTFGQGDWNISASARQPLVLESGK